MISVVVCSRDRASGASFARHVSEATAPEECEFISVEAPPAIAQGYNEGLRRASSDIVVFCHDDIEFLTRDVGRKIRAHLQSFDVVGVAGTDRLVAPGWIVVGHPHIFGQVAHTSPAGAGTPYQVGIYGVARVSQPDIQALDGLFIAFRREVIEAVGWDQESFRGFHMYDVDTTYRAYQMGYRIAVVNDIPILHHTQGSFGDDWRAEAEKFMEKYRGKLPAWAHRRRQFAAAEAQTKAELLEIMCPSWLVP